MSRNLPPHPNLEYLKKQAKDLLHELKQRNPDAQLADAQFALAREYGFASWPNLKTYVDSQSNVEPAELSPFAGKWVANLLKSNRHPANPFQSATIEFIVDNNTVTIIDVVIDESGQEVTGKNTLRVDGVEYATENGSGYVLTAKWKGPHIIETEARKEGQVAGWGRYEVSDDGQTLTISGEEQKIILNRP
ncbi:MAG TPA: hypothetical protein VFQ23_01025 [Anaerolineales bacterium]|nr:hypothetical protein [Anaerolineales bacterium]